MTGQHSLTPSHSHARTRRFRLASLFRGHADIPQAPAADLQDDSDETPHPELLNPRTPRATGHAPRAAPSDDGRFDRSPKTLHRVAAALRAPEPAPAPRPRIWPLPPALPRREGPRAMQVTAMLGCIRYPETGGAPEDYAVVMQRWSYLTGTSSALESPGAWPRPALEAGTEAAA